MMENNNKSDFDGIVPNKASDDPRLIIKQDKRLLSVFLIVLVVLTLISTLIAIIAGFVMSGTSGVIALFTGIVGAGISILEIVILVMVAHNISRTTCAVMKIADMLYEEKKSNNNGESKDTDN